MTGPELYQEKPKRYWRAWYMVLLLVLAGEIAFFWWLTDLFK